MAPVDMVSTTNPELTQTSISEDQMDYFLEEIGIYSEEKGGFVYSCLWKCFICKENIVKNFGSSCKSCVGQLRRKRPYERAFNKARANAPREKKTTGCRIEWRLTYEEFVVLCKIPNCDYCGVFLNRAEHEGDGGNVAMFLDRKDSNEHYTFENCVPCCPRCNNMKGEYLRYSEMHDIMAKRAAEEKEELLKKERHGSEKSKSSKAG